VLRECVLRESGGTSRRDGKAAPFAHSSRILRAFFAHSRILRAFARSRGYPLPKVGHSRATPAAAGGASRWLEKGGHLTSRLFPLHAPVTHSHNTLP
jgi:hypothetical protein